MVYMYSDIRVEYCCPPTCQRHHWELTLSTQDKEDRWPESNSLRRGKLDYCLRRWDLGGEGGSEQ